MLTNPATTSIQNLSVGLPMRICTICDGVEAIISLAAWLAQLSSTTDRLDLEFSDALDVLREEISESWDMVVIVPDPAREDSSPRMVEALLDAVGGRSKRQLVLVRPSARFQLKARDSVQILHGPPFPLFSAGENTTSSSSNALGAVAKETILARLVAKFRKFNPPSAIPSITPMRMIAFQPAAGGSGTTTLALTMTQELLAVFPQLEICVIDLDLQFGNVATYLDIPADSDGLRIYTDPLSVDSDLFDQTLKRIGPGLRILPAPDEILPIDAIDTVGLQHLLALARKTSDLVILDLPPTIGDWISNIYDDCNHVYIVTHLDVRCSNNIKRLLSLIPLLPSSDSKFSIVINDAPTKRDKFWEKRVAAFVAGTALAVDIVIPGGGAEIKSACDSGALSTRLAPSNPVRKALQEHIEHIRPRIQLSQLAAYEE